MGVGERVRVDLLFPPFVAYLVYNPMEAVLPWSHIVTSLILPDHHGLVQSPQIATQWLTARKAMNQTYKMSRQCLPAVV